MEVASLKEQLAAREHAESKLSRQVHSTHAALIQLQQQHKAAAEQIQELLAAKQQHAQTTDSISMLHSLQEQLQHQQQLQECQRSVVFKDSRPLPKEATATSLQNLLNKRLQLSQWLVTVLARPTKSRPQLAAPISSMLFVSKPD